MEGQADTASLGIAQYADVLRRQWRFVAALTMVGALAAGAYLLIAPRWAVATTTLNINAITTDPFNPQRPASGLLDGAAEADIARSHAVAERAAELLGNEVAAQEIRRAVEVRTEQSATVVDITFRAANADEAVDGADAVASAYLEFRSDQAEQRVAKMIDSYTDQIEALDEELISVNDVIADSNPGSTENVQATAQQQQLLTELGDLLSSRNALRSIDSTSGVVLTAAGENTPSFPARTTTVLTGAAAGLVLGVIGAFVRNPRDRRIRGSRELSGLLGVPVLTELDSTRRRLPALETGAAIDLARERILSALQPGSALAVIDTTGEPGRGASPLTARLIAGLDAEPHDLSVLTPDPSDPAEIIAALREADGAVLVFSRSTTDADRARWVGREAEEHGTELLGIVENDGDRADRTARAR